MNRISNKNNKKKILLAESNGCAHIYSTFNNIIITITNNNGNTISWSSAGKMGFKGSKKNTPYAASQTASNCGKIAYDMGLRKVKIYIKGPGSGREAAIRTLQNSGLEITSIYDITPIPHNGCRPPKKRKI